VLACVAGLLLCGCGPSAAGVSHLQSVSHSGACDAYGLQVPEGFSQSCIEALLCYCYSDDLPTGLEPPAVVELLQAASYYGTPR
jgi:hypothetical protein